jgi:type I restriction enzyme S subunit
MFAPRRDRLAPDWIHWLTKTPEFWAQCDEKSRGTSGKNRIKPEQFLSVEIPLPSLVEQQRIVARIDELAAQLQEAQDLRKRAQEEVGAFVVSVHTHLAGERTRRLGEMLRLDEDSVPISPAGSYPQVGVKGFGGGLFTKGPVEGTATTYRAFNRLYEGALILSQVKGWEGAVAVCPRELAGWFASPEYRTFRCISTEVRPGYLSVLVSTEWFWRRLASATRGVGARRERTRPEQFLGIELPMPDTEQQKRGEKLFAEVNVLKRLQAETAAELDSILPAILTKVFAGERIVEPKT